MGEIIELSCPCGYTTRRLAVGGLFSGVAELFCCRTCVAVVSVLVWGSGYQQDLVGDLEISCPDCRGYDLVRFGADRHEGECPRCGREMVRQCLGIAD